MVGEKVEGRLPERYRVIEEVGQGGMAVVYRAHDDALRREVAVKLLHPHLLAEPESKARLEREARAVAKLQHDNIVQIFDYSGQDAPAAFIVTEFIDGQTLKQFVAARRPPPPEVAALIAHEIGCALVHAHAFGIIHRDVKPENVMVRKDGVLKLMDFGVAQIMDLERMTVTGQLLGSPAYMAPEILDGQPIDVRTDIFSVGILLFQVATGSLPFSGRNPHEVLKRIAEGKFADPRTINRQISDRLTKIIARALARRPEDRYPSMAALVADLQTFVADAGLAEAREELQRFLSGPDAYEAALPPRMLRGLIDAGKRERAQKRTARAIELWNRALSIDPKNEEVLGELRRLEGRQHLRRGGLALTGAAAIVGIGFLVYRTVSRPAFAPGEAASVSIAAAESPTPNHKAPGGARLGLAAERAGAARGPKATTRDPSSAEGGVRASERVSRSPVRSFVSRAGTSPKASTGPGMNNSVPTDVRRITVVSPHVFNVKAMVDGQHVVDFDGFRNQFLDLPWNRDHTVKLYNECCEDFVATIGPGRPLKDDKLVARWEGRPASVTITTRPRREGSVLLYDLREDGTPLPGPKSARLNEQVHISFDADDDLRKKLRIVVVDLPGRPIDRDLTVRAGQRLPTVEIELQPND